jgi:predicted nucleic acid-binding protein
VEPDGYVVDTSVIVRWFIAQPGWEHARKIREGFLAGDLSLETVECARFEVPHVLRKHGLLRDQMTRDGYLTACRAIDDLGVTVVYTDADAVEEAAALAADRRISFFDAVFVARALHSSVPLLTADMRLARAVDGFASTVVLDGIGSETDR